MCDAAGVAEAMLGLPGFRVLKVVEDAAEIVIEVELIAALVGCPECGVVARRMVGWSDGGRLSGSGRVRAPVRLRWHKRRFRCEKSACAARTWVESSGAVSARCLLTDRAGRECCLQVRVNARPVAHMARKVRVRWDRVMEAVREHGQPLVDDPQRVGQVLALGVDETS